MTIHLITLGCRPWNPKIVQRHASIEIIGIHDISSEIVRYFEDPPQTKLPTGVDIYLRTVRDMTDNQLRYKFKARDLPSEFGRVFKDTPQMRLPKSGGSSRRGNQMEVDEEDDLLDPGRVPFMAMHCVRQGCPVI